MSRTVIFYDPKFPSSEDALDPSRLEVLERVGAVIGAEALGDALDAAEGGCFVNLHAPYFPKDVWGAILGYLKRGGGLLSAGGAPFRIPVYREDGEWRTEAEQTSYHQKLRIHEVMPVDSAPIRRLAASSDIPLCGTYIDTLTVEPTYSLILHVTKNSDIPKESGSSGPMDAHIYPLVKGINADDREVAAPVVLIENTKGAFAGGRWIFINQRLTERFWAEGGIEAVRAMSDFCARGVTEMWLKPSYSSYDPGDKLKLTFQLQNLSRSWVDEQNGRWAFELQFGKRTNEGAAIDWTHSFALDNSRDLTVLPIRVPVEVEPGMYVIELRAESDKGETRVLRQGVWGFDEELLASGGALTCDRDYFWKEGRPLPIVGMTYMTSDVARKFIFLPNAAVWDRDMETMKRAGINLIRTGIWTGYRHVMYADGHPSEEVLRAIDAFLLTAKRHGLEVTFTFFAFTPETWEGSNPYLDPRSIEAQKRFIAAIVSRHKHSSHVHWDLINEPSMFDPKRIFAGPRSCGDPFEKAAYAEWLKERHGSIRRLQERWGMTPAELPDFSSAVPPEPGEINFDVQDMSQGKKGTRWLDYSLFSADMLNRWALELRRTIRSLSPKQMVTIGQDEALGSQRPSPLLYAESVDYTTNHSWWLMDQLVWDGIFAKTPHKPNLIQETGIMYVETPDGRAKRTEAELRNILERKYAYSFSTGGAGAVQWLWNTNFYMNNINESNIGALRADGTEKPEADVSYDFGRFMNRIRDLFRDRALEDVVVVFPYSNDLSNRRLAVEATSRLTRVLTYELNVHFRAVSEYSLDALDDHPPKLIIVPSPYNFSGEALDTLVRHVSEHGGTVLLTGPAGLNEYWQSVRRLDAELGPRSIACVLREEAVQVGGRLLPLSYGERKIAQLCKEVALHCTVNGGGSRAKSPALEEAAIGRGRLLWCGLPVELSDRAESVRDFYAHILARCGVESELRWERGGELSGVYGRKLAFRDGSLFVFVSEYAYDTDIRVVDPGTGTTYEFNLESERTVMFAADREGRITATYRDDQIRIRTERP
ncbi:glycoside hydrolase [Paenibacillus mesophilus]|uniref:alpha-amylase family protein n=1 Tax=Paenibacillus mesophilus TaxID=2582849 RepID=UPI00110D6DB4|nr:alpha-amylase family protein [Paenibacillus mesophilus]TMV51591.1 glycoside hydrolase [Paenibacillus mesophilus]